MQAEFLILLKQVRLDVRQRPTKMLLAKALSGHFNHADVHARSIDFFQQITLITLPKVRKSAQIETGARAVDAQLLIRGCNCAHAHGLEIDFRTDPREQSSQLIHNGILILADFRSKQWNLGALSQKLDSLVSNSLKHPAIDFVRSICFWMQIRHCDKLMASIEAVQNIEA